MRGSTWARRNIYGDKGIQVVMKTTIRKVANLTPAGARPYNGKT